VTPAQARSWVRLRRAELAVRWGLVVAWCGALALAIAPPDVACRPDDPSLCAPDPVAAGVLALVLAAPALLALAPLTGCAVAVVVGVLEVTGDLDASARAGFGGLAALAAVAGPGLWAARRSQRRLAAAGATTTPPRRPLQLDETRLREVRLGRRAAAVVLVVVALALAFAQVQATAALAARERGAQRVVAVVTGHDDGSLLRVDVAPGLGVPVRDVGAYPVGSRLPVLVADADGEPWVRPVAEPEDVTYWLTFALVALVAAGLLEASRRRARSRLARIVAAPLDGPVLLATPDARGRAVLRAGDVVLAAVPVVLVYPPGAAPPPEEDPEEDVDVAAFGRAWRGDPEEEPPEPVWRPVTVGGDLCTGGWVVLAHDDTVLVPEGSVRSRLRRPLTAPHDAGGPPEHEPGALPGEPVVADAALVAGLADGEIVLRPPSRSRLAGAGLLVLAAALLVAVRSPLTDSVTQRLMIGFVGTQWLVLGWRRLTAHVVADRRRVVVPALLRTHEVPWPAVHGVRRDGDQLALAWADVVVVVGPFEGPGSRTATAQSAGAALAALRERAVALAAPDAPVRARWSPVVGAAVCYALLVVLAVVW
jgi:hypothetical protein